MDVPMGCSTDTSGGLSDVAPGHISRAIVNSKYLIGRARGTPHGSSAHQGNCHDIMVYTMTFHGIHHAVAHGMENLMVFPMVYTMVPFHGWLNIECDPWGVPWTSYSLALTLTVGHAVVCSMVKPWHRRIDNGSVRGVNHDAHRSYTSRTPRVIHERCHGSVHGERPWIVPWPTMVYTMVDHMSCPTYVPAMSTAIAHVRHRTSH